MRADAGTRDVSRPIAEHAPGTAAPAAGVARAEALEPDHPRINEFCRSIGRLGPAQWREIARRYLDNERWSRGSSAAVLRELLGTGRGLTALEELGRLSVATRLYEDVCCGTLGDVPPMMDIDGGEVPCRDVARLALIEALRALLLYDALRRRPNGEAILTIALAPFFGMAVLPPVARDQT